jgi:hypothetical protein
MTEGGRVDDEKTPRIIVKQTGRRALRALRLPIEITDLD